MYVKNYFSFKILQVFFIHTIEDKYIHTHRHTDQTQTHTYKHIYIYIQYKSFLIFTNKRSLLDDLQLRILQSSGDPDMQYNNYAQFKCQSVMV